MSPSGHVPCVNVPAPVQRQRRAPPPPWSPSASLPPLPPPRRLLSAPPPTFLLPGYAATATAPRWHRVCVRHPLYPAMRVRPRSAASLQPPPRNGTTRQPTRVSLCAAVCRRGARAVVSHSSHVSPIARRWCCTGGAIWRHHKQQARRMPPPTARLRARCSALIGTRLDGRPSGGVAAGASCSTSR